MSSSPDSVRPLRELISLVVHDLSNPLQSLSMLLELAEDEVPPGGDAHDRLREAGEAAVAMRDLIRRLGDFNRGARSPDGQLAAGVLVSTFGLLRRRFERQGMAFVDRTETVGDAPAPAGFQTLVLTLVLSALAAETPGYPATLELCVSIEDGALVFDLRCLREGSAQEWPLSPPHLAYAATHATSNGVAFTSTASQARVNL